MATRVTGVDTYAVGNGESDRKSSDGSPVEVIGSNGMEMSEHRVTNEDDVNPEVLEHSLQVLENKKTAWWAYLTTRDFWLVLLIGYVHPSAQDPRLIRLPDKFLPSASLLPTPSLLSSSTREPPSQLSRRSSTTSCSVRFIRPTQSTATASRDTSESSRWTGGNT